jgi:surfeit locus 1 family protein
VIGAQRLQVLARDGAPPVLVDEGWIPTEGKPPPAATGPARVEGYVRLADKPNFLSAEDDPAAKHFYTLDPGAIGAALGVTNLAPFTVVAMGAAPPGAPAPATELPRPPNNHLQYAFTWFGLAAALAGVFAVWVRKPADT